MDQKDVKEKDMISPFEEKQIRGIVFLMDCHLLDMMQECQMSLRYLLT